MFHLKYPQSRGFCTWNELGCLSRAVGFPVGLFREHVSYEIHTDENGMSLQEVYKMLDYKLLYDALHFTQNMHTAEWNMCVIRRAATILDHHALTYTDLYNIRLGYEAYEAPDMKGMVIDQHKMMRALKMCNLMISPLKLMHRIKHSRDRFDEPGRVQLYEFIDLMLWAEVYQSYVPEKGYALFEMENELFKLVDFDKLLAHHDEKQASRLDARYLKEEWEFPDTKVSKTFKFKDLTVVSGDSRVEVTSHQKKTYKGLRTEVSRSQKMVHCIKGGFIRERPVTAPDLRRYDLQALEEYKRKQSAQAQRAIYNRLHDLIQMVYDKDKGGDVQPVDFSDRPEIPETKRCQTAAVVSPEELDEARRHLECLLFDIETEVGRHEITRDSDMESFIPKYKEKRDMEVERKFHAWRNTPATQYHRRHRKDPRDNANDLAYPVPRIPPSHAKKCDARESQLRLQSLFRGWYDIRSKKGSHYILLSPFLADSPKGQLLKKMTKMSNAQIRNVHGNILYRKTKGREVDRRPVTAPAVVSMKDYQSSISKGSHSEHVTIGEVTEVIMPKENQEECEVEENESTKEKHMTEKGEVSPDSGIQTMTESCETIDSSVSEKLKLLLLINESANDLRDKKPRATSAYVHRHEKMLSNPDTIQGFHAVDDKPRSISAPGDRSMVEDIAPIPYMDHSKARTVKVGSIGHISLLENISEARFWEALVEENGDITNNRTSGTDEKQIHTEGEKSRDNEKIEESQRSPSGKNLRINENGATSPNKKSRAKQYPEDVNGNGNLNILLEIEEKKRIKELRNMKKHFFHNPNLYSKTPTTLNRRHTANESTSQSSELKDRSHLKPSHSCPFQHSKQTQSNRTPKSSQGKYAGLVKRLGDDMTPFMKKLMLKSS
ncbi:uncharacterized protein LOC127841534 isoform X1 [Dreissena polymorpha]|uniref:uncharacterized protein LOC127841534 isoform X1 n=1 Tax=Dreissena polymorpha TaxID=45954 RepID=UPI00226524CD|nr:uncharacterized protein LOC127841534 isoform X1 [Dreissena polymorpha]